MSRYAKTESPGYVKDLSSGVVLNTNVGEYELIKAARRQRRERLALEEKLAKIEKLLEKA